MVVLPVATDTKKFLLIISEADDFSVQVTVNNSSLKTSLLCNR